MKQLPEAATPKDGTTKASLLMNQHNLTFRGSLVHNVTANDNSHLPSHVTCTARLLGNQHGEIGIP